MKRLARLSIPAQAQVLLPGVADCVLDLIRFKAVAVTGWDLTVTQEGLESWRNHLAYWYPRLPNKYSIANACREYENETARWQMHPGDHGVLRNIWSAGLKRDLALIEPVFPDGARHLYAALQSRDRQQYAPPAPQNEAEALREFERQQGIRKLLQGFWRRR